MVFGVFNIDKAGNAVALGLHSFQHRGQEETGIVSYEKPHFHSHKALGLVGKSFSKQNIISRLKGSSAIGHNRYATTGTSSLDNAQPIFVELSIGGCALAHNGNLTNSLYLRKQLIEKGAVFSSTGDSETILHLMSNTSGSMKERCLKSLHKITGSFALIMLTQDYMIGARDPWGIRPLVLGRLEDSYILASETCALSIIGASFIREVEQGEVVIISKNPHGRSQLESIFLNNRKPHPRPCLFEYVYFSRPDSIFASRSIYDSRCNFGKQLAIEHPVNADIVVPIPDSGNPAAIGLANQLNIPFHLGIVRNHYVGRTFIQPTASIRNLDVQLKHSINTESVKNKKIILVDDSIVRGTTSRQIISMLKAAGVKEIHLRIACPPIKFPCFYGINISTEDKLVANDKDNREIAEFIGVDSLEFLSIDGLYRALGHPFRDPQRPAFTDHYFTGDYPTELKDYEEDLIKASNKPMLHNIEEHSPEEDFSTN